MIMCRPTVRGGTAHAIVSRFEYDTRHDPGENRRGQPGESGILRGVRDPRHRTHGRHLGKTGLRDLHPSRMESAGRLACRARFLGLIFNNTFSMKFELTEILVQVAGDVAWVICTENITSRQGEAVQESQVLATNLYERIDDRWYIIHHHASPVMG